MYHRAMELELISTNLQKVLTKHRNDAKSEYTQPDRLSCQNDKCETAFIKWSHNE